jgi:hypothetical protein
MEFTSINEYFYKFYSVVLFVLLLPILGFIALYVRTFTSLHDLELYSDQLMFTSISVITLWMLIFILFNKKLKSIRNAPGLRQKLEKYFRLTIVRYTVFLVCSFALLTIFFVSGNDLFTLIFVIQLLISGMVWPTPAKVSADLKLRGDEREMVYYKKDVLS